MSPDEGMLVYRDTVLPKLRRGVAIVDQKDGAIEVLVQLFTNGKIINFREPVDEFPTDKLLAQLVLLAG